MQVRRDFRTPDEKNSSPATPEDLAKALNALAEPDLRRLDAFARYRLFAMVHPGSGRDHTDLLHEAIASTLDGKRPWKPEKVTLTVHLLGAMRSIAFAWHQKDKTQSRVMPPEETETDEDGERASMPFHNFPAREPSPEKQLEAKETIRAVMDCFRDDHVAQQILTALMDGLRSPEIIKALGMRPVAYHTVRRRIQRRLQKLFDPKNEWEKRKRTASEVP
jgi:DNA-directed RNA polymerase specialized sigma24 family protein